MQTLIELKQWLNAIHADDLYQVELNGTVLEVTRSTDVTPKVYYSFDFADDPVLLAVGAEAAKAPTKAESKDSSKDSKK